MSRKYRVTIYNQHLGDWVEAEGRTRKEAFNRALTKAGESFLRYGGDKLTTFRTLFVENLMHPYYRTKSNAYVSHPNGAGVEFRRLS